MPLKYKYKAYGIDILSAIALPKLYILNDDIVPLNPIEIKIGKVPLAIENPLEKQELGSHNEREHLFYLPKVAKYYIVDGKSITIEPVSDQWDEILPSVYYNCLVVAMLQRNLLTFHVSGIFVEKNQVLLFAAPSGTGKSTTAAILRQKGYTAFTDDSALLTIENNRCYAQASYPEVRLREKTIHYLNSLKKEENYTKQTNYPYKYSLNFNEEFSAEKANVVGIVFLDTEGTTIKVEKIAPAIALTYWGNNIYLNHWNGMKKSHLLFQTLTSLAHHVPAYKATRPLDTDSFDAFSEDIIAKIINS